jgi:hypothetical protein
MAFNEYKLTLTPGNPVQASSILGGAQPQVINEYRLPDPFPAEAFLERLPGLRDAVSRLIAQGGSDPEPQEFGRRLYEAIFRDSVLIGFRAALALAQNTDRGLRLRFECPAAWHALPLELAFRTDAQPHDFLALNRNLSVARFCSDFGPLAPGGIHRPMRILVIAFSPFDRVPLDTRSEIDRLLSALSDLVSSGAVVLDFVDGPDTLTQIISRFGAAGNYHVWHVIGHGEEEARQGVRLMMEDANRMAAPVGHMHLWQNFQGGALPRLVVLNVCQGAAAQPRLPFASLAAMFVQMGVPAVVAHQAEVRDDAAPVIARHFYRCLARGEPVDTALVEARLALQDGVQRLSPVLFLQQAGGDLFLAPIVQPAHPLAAQSLAAATLAARQSRWGEAASYAQTALLIDPGSPGARASEETYRGEERLDRNLHEARHALSAGDWSEALKWYAGYRGDPRAANRPRAEREHVEVVERAARAAVGFWDARLEWER